ncbi:MAG TPA: hypothetical protein VKT29_09285 [Terriglobales bacterium]|nr:hypothetical protein [Terriglobales bacterium]
MRLILPIILVLASLSVSPAFAQVPKEFFGMHVAHRDQIEWPTVDFGSLRLWDTRTNWAQINRRPGVYDWDTLDRRLEDAREHHLEVLYTFGKTPRWASSRPDDHNRCGMAPGMCGAPKDLNPDGTGSDQYWKDFVAAIAKHAAGRIKYWELWNEPYNQPMWKGTVQQLVRMAQDAQSIIKSIDPEAVVLSPPSGIREQRAKEWFRSYLAAGGGRYADGIAFHAYIKRPENIVDYLEDYRHLLSEYGQGSKPLFDTECSWGDSEQVEDPVSSLSRLYILQAAFGVRRVYWYAWGNPRLGTIWNPQQGPLPAAHALEQLENWLVGATFSSPCSGREVWTCDISKDNGSYHGRIVWLATPGQTGDYKLPSGFTVERELDGRRVSLTGGSINISNRPVLLEGNH